MSGEKAKYRVLRLSHIHNQLWEEGAEVEYDGVPGSALEPLNDAAKKAKAAGKKLPVEITAGGLGGNEPLNDGDDELEKLREDYEALFGEKPHFNTKAETLREKIAEERQRLGV